MVTEDDKNSICYFISQRGDITRWVDWEKRKQDITTEYPELILALNNVEIAKKALDAVIKTISNEIQNK